ncbi:flagellar hook-length control protein FliK [Luteibacter sp.]|uniref:flagellar hook-length control protein FliK n=1 Tax=Luteibacter sp. TaxID=1886636 RepID=UPI003F81F693
MNNTSLLLHAARPSASAATHASSPVAPASSPATASSTASDASAAQKPFNHAMNAARADNHAHKADDSQHDTTAKSQAGSPDDKAPASAADSKKDDTAGTKDDDTTKKDDGTAGGDGTSLAASMLALIGVPTQVTQVAANALGAAKDVVTGHAGDALAALTGAKGDAATVTAGALNALPAAVTETTTTAPTPLSAFAALLGAKGAGTDDAKDETRGLDPAAGPMPLAHTQAPGQLNGPMQLQATQPATSPQFSQELGEQIAWMSSAAGDVKEARIKLHPEELGSMDVRVNVDGGKVNVAIMAQHPAAVHAVQQTLSNLDTMLAHHGLSLGQAEVNQGGAQQNGGQQGSGQGGSADSADASGDALVTAGTSRVSRGLVDEVA